METLLLALIILFVIQLTFLVCILFYLKDISELKKKSFIDLYSEMSSADLKNLKSQLDEIIKFLRFAHYDLDFVTRYLATLWKKELQNNCKEGQDNSNNGNNIGIT